MKRRINIFSFGLVVFTILGCLEKEIEENDIEIKVYSAYPLEMIYPLLIEVNNEIINIEKEKRDKDGLSLINKLDDKLEEGTPEYYESKFPLFKLFSPNTTYGENAQLANSVNLGFSESQNLSKLIEYFSNEKIKRLLPENLDWKYYNSFFSNDHYSIVGVIDQIIKSDGKFIDSIIAYESKFNNYGLLESKDRITGEFKYTIAIKFNDDMIKQLNKEINQTDSLFAITFKLDNQEYVISTSINQLSNERLIIGESFSESDIKKLKNALPDKCSLEKIESPDNKTSQITLRDLNAFKKVLNIIGGAGEINYINEINRGNENPKKYVELTFKNCPWILEYNNDITMVSKYAVIHFFMNSDKETRKENESIVVKFTFDKSNSLNANYEYEMKYLEDVYISYQTIESYIDKLKNSQFSDLEKYTISDSYKRMIDHKATFDKIKETETYDIFSFETIELDNSQNENGIIVLFNIFEENQVQVNFITETGTKDNLIVEIQNN